MNTNCSLIFNRRRISGIGAVVALLPGPGRVAACRTQQQAVAMREDNLAAAGFIVRPANTPGRQTMLQSVCLRTALCNVHKAILFTSFTPTRWFATVSMSARSRPTTNTSGINSS
jgi:hypothetical protein